MSTRTAFLIVALATFWAPLSVSAEVIESFNSTIELERDATFTVIEEITYDFGAEDRHGIFRDIPKGHPQDATGPLRERYIEIDVRSVTREDSAEPYDLSESGGEVRLKIGDPDRTITGAHTYEITYEVRGGLSYFDDGTTELYWNVTGTEWTVPIEEARATLVAEEGLLSEDRACYEGRSGTTERCSQVIEANGEVTFAAQGLEPGEGLTIAHALDGEAGERVVLERVRTLWIWAVVLLVWFVGLGYAVYRYRTKHRTGRPIIAQYEPYEDFKPMYTGVLADGSVDPKDITAGIVYLAEQGFLKIKKTERKVFFFFDVDDYEITLRRTPGEGELTRFQTTLLELLFGTAQWEGKTVALSELKKDHSKQKVNRKILKRLKKDVEQDLEERGFFDINVPRTWVTGGIVFSVALVVIFLDLVVALVPFTLLPLIVLVAGTVIILFFAIRRRTRKGYEALDHLKGFKRFLSVTDTERFKFHNAPAKSPETFMEYLPYAIAFGVEKEWAEVFEDITIPDPEWYDGGSAGHFSATNFSTSLGAFSTAFAGSTGASGASGGGSVGGGGGGGGGGSW